MPFIQLGRLLITISLLLTISSCSHSADPASLLAVSLPQSPSGWKMQGDPVKENIEQVGSRAVAIYKPTPENSQAKGVDRIEIHVVGLAQYATKDKFKQLRKHDAVKAMFMKARKIGDLNASECAPTGAYTDWHIIVINVTDKILVDVIAFPAHDKSEWDTGAEHSTELFATAVEYLKLKALNK